MDGQIHLQLERVENVQLLTIALCTEQLADYGATEVAVRVESRVTILTKK